MQNEELLDLCRRLIVLKVAGLAADTPVSWPKFSFQELKQLVDIALYIESTGIESVAEWHTNSPTPVYGSSIAQRAVPSGMEVMVESLTSSLREMSESRQSLKIVDLISSINMLPADDPLRPRMTHILEVKIAAAEALLPEGGIHE